MFDRPATAGLAKAKGGFVAGAAVGCKLAQRQKIVHEFSMMLCFGGEAILHGADKAVNGTAFACGNFERSQFMAQDYDGFVDPVEEGIGIDGVLGKIVPAAQIAVKQVIGQGQGEVGAFATEAGEGEEAEGERGGFGHTGGDEFGVGCGR